MLKTKEWASYNTVLTLSKKASIKDGNCLKNFEINENKFELFKLKAIKKQNFLSFFMKKCCFLLQNVTIQKIS